jgi:hypothetical protein
MKLAFWRKDDPQIMGATLPVLPATVDDNMYLAAASEAAFKDKNSGAYDEYLFVENGLTKMPFEVALESHLALVSNRLRSQYVREVSKPNIELIELKGHIQGIEKEIAHAEKFEKTLTDKLAAETAVLAGEKVGRAGLYWPSDIPEASTKWSIRGKRLIDVLTYLFVAAADIVIIMFSFINLGLGQIESIFFTLPVVGIQIAFPHFAGDRINLMMHKSKSWFVNIGEMVVLLVGWLGFSLAVTQIRYELIAGNDTVDLETNPALGEAIMLAMFLMLVGLGTWILFKSVRHNPHESKYRSISLDIIKQERRLLKLRTRREHYVARVPALEAGISSSTDAYGEAIETASGELIEAAKSVYRRALINQIGTPTFTASYIGNVTGQIGREDSGVRLDRNARKPSSTPVVSNDMGIAEERGIADA